MLYQLLPEDDGSVLLSELEIAETFWSRFVGLQFRRQLRPQQGLLLRPCSSLHTCFMRFPIDVVMLSSDNVVLGVKHAVRPWRAVFCVAGTKSVIETAPNAISCHTGDRVRIVEVNDSYRVA